MSGCTLVEWFLPTSCLVAVSQCDFQSFRKVGRSRGSESLGNLPNVIQLARGEAGFWPTLAGFRIYPVGSADG